MAVTACIPNQAKLDMIQGVHLAADVYKVALYTQAAASFDASSTVYSATGEVAASGTYAAGGATLSGYSAALAGSVAGIDWTTDPSWTGATITADCAVIYNSSKTNKILAILTFTSASSTAGTWTLQLPAAGATAIIVSFFGAMLLILLGVIGFAGKKWFDHIDRLQASVELLRESLLSLSDKFVTQIQHRSDLEALRMRRATDSCPHEECPYEKTDPAITLTGSGAKSLKELIEAMRTQSGAR